VSEFQQRVGKSAFTASSIGTISFLEGLGIVMEEVMKCYQRAVIKQMNFWPCLLICWLRVYS